MLPTRRKSISFTLGANPMAESMESMPLCAPDDLLESSPLEREYPRGLQLFFILIALILSVFMVALDLVGRLAKEIHIC